MIPPCLSCLSRRDPASSLTRLFLAAVVAALLVLGAGRALAEEAALDVQQIASELGYDDADVGKLLKGEIVSRQLAKEDAKELAATVAMVVDQRPALVYGKLERREFLGVNRTILSWGEIDPKAPLESLARLELPAKEVDSLAKARPGRDWNLSAAGFESIRKVTERLAGAPEDERRAAVMQAYRKLLADRATAFAAKGIAGIASYARDGEPADPGRDLAGGEPGEDSLIARVAPGFRAAFVSYPNVSGDAVEASLLWLVQDIQDRPTVVLALRLFGRDHGNAFFAERDFYVAHSFDALQIMVGCLPLGERTVVFYGNRTYTEQVTGFGSGAAHAIGRKVLIGEVKTLFDAVRAASASPS